LRKGIIRTKGAFGNFGGVKRESMGRECGFRKLSRGKFDRGAKSGGGGGCATCGRH